MGAIQLGARLQANQATTKPMTFSVGLTPDLLTSKGEFSFDPALLRILEGATVPIRWEIMEDAGPMITPAQTARYDAIHVSTPRVTEASFGDGPTRLRIVARHGVGFDTIDQDALTRRGILLTNTPEAVRRPVAAMTLTFMLALGQRLMLKDRLTREGRWAERNDYMGQGLTGRVLGMVGAGSIAQEIARVVAPFEMRVIASGRAEAVGVAAAPAPPGRFPLDRVPLKVVLRESDYIVAICPLNESTHHLIGREAFEQMKPGAYFINVARGAVVDEAALIEALRNKRIAGAALDVFEQEPVDPKNPLLRMDNVIVTPHALCWTDETFDGIARTALTSIADALSGREPKHVVNKAALLARGNALVRAEPELTPPASGAG
jgi:phosphoglycerate dehydrogenase-like enzyme